MNRRTIITAAPAALLATTVPTLAADADAELHHMIAAYHAMTEAHGEVDIDSPENRGQHALLERIAEFAPRTVKGAIAKLRLGFDDDELQSLDESGPLDRISAASVRDVLRLLGEA